MGLVDSVKGLPVLLLVALILILVANLFNGIAFSTTAWGEYFSYIANSNVIDPTARYTNVGLWRTCTGTQVTYALDGLGACSYTALGTAQGWMACVQAMAVFGFAGILGSLILMMAYLLGEKNGDYLLLAAFICIITGVLYFIGIVIYGVKFYSPVITSGFGRTLSWSFGLAVISMILEIVAGVLLLLGRKGTATSPS
ncbi:uncharacterized protein LOC135468888 [Liolophura sinensis]|uniref:uncharacterized protein LOC135468888 n=1 Tax=Liolophura sinensis TaxID=3198878 RepID=UPI00315873BB